MQRNWMLALCLFLLGFTGILLAQNEFSSPRNPVAQGDIAAPPKAEKNLYFRTGDRGEIQVPLIMNREWISVRFNSQVTEEDARSFLSTTAGVDTTAARELELTEKNSAYLRIAANLSEKETENLLRTLSANDFVLYAEPIYQHADERLGGTNRIIVKAYDSQTLADLEAFFAGFDARIVRTLGSGANTFVLELAKNARYDSLELPNFLLEKFPDIFEWANPDFVIERKFNYTPNDPLYPNQWHLNSTGQGGALVNADVNAPQAWDITQGSASIVVAVIDTGIDTTHEDISFVAGWDPVGNDNNPSPGSGENHGTSVSGVIAAKGSNSLGLSGSCPNCKIMPIRLIVSGATLADEAEAFNFAWQNGAAIINNSWGPVGSVATLPSSTKAAIDAATTSGRGGKGCVIFFAAGNDNVNVNQNGYAAYTKVIAVAASTDQDLKAYYSNWGTALDICAPSNGGNSTGIWTTDRMGSLGYSTGNYTNNFGGTSSASPLAAGVAGLVLSVNPNLTYTEVRTNLTSTATQIDLAGGSWSGGFSSNYGYGKVNAQAAVVAAQGGGGGGGTTQTFSSTNVPLSIPDNNTTGITSNLTIATTGTINSVTCNVNISHTYVGDLIVTLIHPDNSSTVLWNQAGGAADNIVQSFSVSTFNGKAMNGTWKLKVQDVAAQDVGTLNSWSLTINYTPSGGGPTSYTYNWSSTNVPLSIPDNNTVGITSNLPTSAMQGTITSVSVTMNITHTYKGDLRVTLIHPDNTQVILHNQTGGSADNIITTFPVPTAPYQSLSLLNGKAPNGTWKLKVQDLAAQDVGTLNSWSIQVNTVSP